MARPKKTVEKALTEKIPRTAMLSEAGGTGLRIVGGIPQESELRELQFPNNIKVYKMMQYDSTISSGLNLFTMLIKRSRWNVRAPLNARAEPGMDQHVKFLQECKDDMESPFSSMLEEVASKIQYGFCINEIVLRRRLKSAGSKFNDGKIGIRKLPIRSQSSIEKFIYDENQELVAVKQNLSMMQNSYAAYTTQLGTHVILPINKILLFRTGTQKENPIGRSPLDAVYFDWKYRCTIQENESIGAARDLGGIPLIKIPPQYMSTEATPEQKAIYEQYKNIVRNISSGNQSGLVLPQQYDPDTKLPLFSFELLSIDGSKLFDTNEIINRYDRKILTTLMADLLIMGQSSTGSYSLGTIKSELVNLAVESHLMEIQQVLNKDLVPRLFKANGIELENYPEFYFEELEGKDLDLLSKFIQRIAAVGFMDKDLETMNKIRDVMGVSPLPEDFDIEKFKAETADAKTKAGEGMKEGLPGGTGKAVSAEDDSVANKENA